MIYKGKHLSIIIIEGESNALRAEILQRKNKLNSPCLFLHPDAYKKVFCAIRVQDRLVNSELIAAGIEHLIVWDRMISYVMTKEIPDLLCKTYNSY